MGNTDGLMGAQHTHYCPSVLENRLLHKRNAKQILGYADIRCADIRLGILLDVKRQLSTEWIEKKVDTLITDK